MRQVSNYNFTNGSEMLGVSTITAGDAIYSFTIDLELIHILLIVIMLCQLAQTGYIFLRHTGLIKK